MRILVVALALSAAVAADEVVLKSGGRMSCEVIEVTDAHVRVRLPHGTMVIPRAKVVRIVREKRTDYLKREGAASLRAGSTRNAVELLERAYLADRKDEAAKGRYLDALLRHAEVLRADHRLGDAHAALQTLLDIDDKNAAALALLRTLRQAEAEGARAYERALDAYQRRDYDSALELFDAWRLQQPTGDRVARGHMAVVHIAAGEADLERRALQDSLNHFRAAAAFGARDLDRVLFLLQPIAVLEALAGGETARAARLIDVIATRYPDRAVPIFLRAVTHHVRGEVSDAVRDYAAAARAADGSKPKDSLSYDEVRRQATAILRAAIARPPQEGQNRWREMFLAPLHRHDAAEHFTVFAPTRRQAEELGKRADALYERLARELLGRLPAATKVELVLHPTRQAYTAADPVPPNSPVALLSLPRTRSAGVAYDALDEKGRAVIRVEVYDDRRLLEDTLPHEIVHVVQRRGLAVHRKAHWLDEGLAMLYESDAGQRARVATLKTAKLIPLAEFLALRSTPRDRGGVYYDQAYAVTDYLRGLGNWPRFLDVFARGGLKTALNDVHDIATVDELERQLLSALERS